MNRLIDRKEHLVDKITQRIRGLLDKAESTEFDAERDTFIAAATKLMAKHQVDMAAVSAAGRTTERGEVGVRRLGGFGRGPYVMAKASLAAVAGEAAGCRVWRSDTHVVFCGYDDQTASAEVLYTSLLVQTTRGAARDYRPAHGSRTSYNRNYMLGFATEVRERVRAAAKEQLDGPNTAGPGTALVLRDTKDAIAAFMADSGVRLQNQRTYVTNEAGLQGGRTAGSRADLGNQGLRSTPALPSL